MCEIALSKGKGKGKTVKTAAVAPATFDKRFSVFAGIDPFSIGAEWTFKSAPEPTTTRALVRNRQSHWKTDIIESTPVCSGDFPELPKPQRVTRSTRKTLNLTKINSTPTSLKRGPPLPNSPTEDEETSRMVSPPHKKKIGQNIKTKQTNIDSISRPMGHCEWATVIPKPVLRNSKLISIV